jgi:hypothetical protein
MSLRSDRKAAHKAMLEGKFVEQSLRKHAKEINVEIRKRQQGVGFRSGFWNNMNFTINNNTMVYRHTKQHRFIDMRTRRKNDGTVLKKKAYPHHNRVLYGHANNLVRQLAFGFVASIREEMQQLIENNKI